MIAVAGQSFLDPPLPVFASTWCQIGTG